MLLKKKEEDEVEHKKKEELIRKIREIQKQPKERTKGYDPTETSFLKKFFLIKQNSNLSGIGFIGGDVFGTIT